MSKIRKLNKFVKYDHDDFFDSEVQKTVNVNPFFLNMFLKLSMETECETFPEELSGYPIELLPFLKCLYQKNNQPPPTLINNIELPKIQY